ncbi:pentatricopeptide repeat-containing protein At4g14190, chloroplastic [Telopea speciosissima]|uniref:pentatricopeptide repeat-containing protein At4g14190, chloroplastic n=1 Tax=Telopea speciosissima TaxID=54955 RepID=UPI001CC628C7|nr:pentatricopeptide repeat-containing protein At4g14190, chloroplastic [Telopea speciosissima]XP_043720490.1 pentatricopeptide repeat-containing protein At4g14190, chloroplastic [Telopea speciosissima]XP_043720491.1 pentatricopeptide repeat-containing protein At4g14190, chloroplastic [Telopea speciosissima]XP_043720492.1 pentatricopeptide repeat-containing protein At4g14190, chloroplastic [Telopea speciosissima]
MDSRCSSLDFCKYKTKWSSNSPCRTLSVKLFVSSTIHFPLFPSHSALSTQFKSHAQHTSLQHSTEKHTTLLVETFHENRILKTLFGKLSRMNSNPLQILQDDGDWSKDHFWAVMRFLKETSRSKEALQVFDMWKNIEKSRINEVNYGKLIEFLGEVGLMDEAASLLRDMKSNALSPSLEIYNSLIHGFARKGEFDNALFYFEEIEEMKLKPLTKTYNGLIQAYGDYRMYDEMNSCVKRMELEGCVPDDDTYNVLIRELARGGLIRRMERVYRTLLSKRMSLQSSALIAMLEVYVNLGILEKMEKAYRKVLNTKTPLNEGLIRKLARVYIENHMFSRLEDLGLDIASRKGRTDLFWCLRLLSQACLLSKKGMSSIAYEMEIAKSSWNITVANIIALAYLKMRDLRLLDAVLSDIQTKSVKPDIVTIGVFFDADDVGFDGMRALDAWRGMGLLEESVAMDTDPLVLTAFGKGHFLRSCEEMYSSLGPEAREKRVWTYHDLIENVLKHNGKSSFLRAKTD